MLGGAFWLERVFCVNELMSQENPWLINTTDETFQVDVMERSKLGLVVVDFWAEWCAPCRMLGPVLEKLASESDGKFTLVKAETEQNTAAAGEFSVGGIPAVFAVVDGQIVDRFEGAMPEPAILEWLDGLTQKIEIQQVVSAADAGDQEALARLAGLWKTLDQDEAILQIGLTLMKYECFDEVSQILVRLESRGFLEPEAEQLKAALALKIHGEVDPEGLRVSAEANPEDLEIQLSLARALVGSASYEEAFDICLHLIEVDRMKTGESARELMIEVFKALPPDEGIVADYRRRLSMLLF